MTLIDCPECGREVSEPAPTCPNVVCRSPGRPQGRGLAEALLKHFLLKALDVADITGVRLVLVHAKYAQATSFYRHHGLESSPVDDLTLMLLIKDIHT